MQPVHHEARRLRYEARRLRYEAPVAERRRMFVATGALRSGAVLCGALAVGAVVIGCGAPGLSPTSAAVRATCQDVAAVLSDGPDPSADPVGHAEAQILPLRQIHSSDPRLQAAIDGLASAYQQFFDTKGTGSAKRAVNGAMHELTSICPALAP
ncbi:MAG: hypothetical protein ACLP7F_12725 [Acidimicrobiales bacterium]